jgi:hypothetical protein
MGIQQIIKELRLMTLTEHQISLKSNKILLFISIISLNFYLITTHVSNEYQLTINEKH